MAEILFLISKRYKTTIILKGRLYLLGHDHEMPYVHLGNLVRKE